VTCNGTRLGMRHYWDGAVVNGSCDIARRNFRKKSRTFEKLESVGYYGYPHYRFISFSRAYRIASHGWLARNDVFSYRCSVVIAARCFNFSFVVLFQLASMISSSDSRAVLDGITE
jgi:hypothetical protein